MGATRMPKRYNCMIEKDRTGDTGGQERIKGGAELPSSEDSLGRQYTRER